MGGGEGLGAPTDRRVAPRAWPACRAGHLWIFSQKGSQHGCVAGGQSTLLGCGRVLRALLPCRAGHLWILDEDNSAIRLLNLLTMTVSTVVG